MRIIRFFASLLLALLLAIVFQPPSIQASSDSQLLEEHRFTRSTLENGIEIYIQENHTQKGESSFRVVLKKALCEHLLYAYETRHDISDYLEDFLSYCASKIHSQATDAQEINQCIPLFKKIDCPEEVAIIAVGDFSADAMLQLIDKHFSAIPFTKAQWDRKIPIYIASDPDATQIVMDISYSSLRRPIQTEGDLALLWKFLVLQDLFQERMKRAIYHCEETWVNPHPRFLFPVSGHALISQENSEHVLAYILWQIELLREEGFSIDEFLKVKHKLLQQVQYVSMQNVRADNAVLASYFVDQFILGGDCLKFSSFLSCSQRMLEEMSLSDLLPQLSTFLSNHYRAIHLIYPKALEFTQLTVADVEKIIQKVEAMASFYHENSVLEEEHINTSATEDPSYEIPFIFAEHTGNESFELAPAQPIVSAESFYRLPISDKEQRLIYDIIRSMGEKNIVQLLFEKNNLEKKGKKINHVHPMRFIGYILSDHKLRNYLREVKNSSFKWDHFIDGFSKRMREEAARNNLLPHVHGLAQLLHADPEHITSFIHHKNWEGLVKSLL